MANSSIEIKKINLEKVNEARLESTAQSVSQYIVSLNDWSKYNLWIKILPLYHGGIFLISTWLKTWVFFFILKRSEQEKSGFMPIYEYQCTACHHHFDTIQGFKEKALEICPACHQPTLQKLISAPAFHLKGTGWYVTDFKKSTPAEGATSKKEVESSKQEAAPKEAAASTSESTSSTQTKSDVSKSDK